MDLTKIWLISIMFMVIHGRKIVEEYIDVSRESIVRSEIEHGGRFALLYIPSKLFKLSKQYRTESRNVLDNYLPREGSLSQASEDERPVLRQKTV